MRLGLRLARALLTDLLDFGALLLDYRRLPR